MHTNTVSVLVVGIRTATSLVVAAIEVSLRRPIVPVSPVIAEFYLVDVFAIWFFGRRLKCFCLSVVPTTERYCGIAIRPDSDIEV